MCTKLSLCSYFHHPASIYLYPFLVHHIYIAFFFFFSVCSMLARWSSMLGKVICWLHLCSTLAWWTAPCCFERFVLCKFTVTASDSGSTGYIRDLNLFLLHFFSDLLRSTPTPLLHPPHSPPLLRLPPPTPSPTSPHPIHPFNHPVAIVVLPSLISLLVSVDVKHHVYLLLCWSHQTWTLPPSYLQPPSWSV